ncbi:hypothetical protein B0H14DRAFT_3490363 [Mycena olivaceomarginata]|nr:hypothetical protein B0H14DRAFT_3490363 [Mycena olivaceomarginata]
MSPLRSRPPTAPSDHENALHNTMEDPHIIEGTPPRSMYIDDQAEEDTDAEMDDSEGDYDDEDSMEAQAQEPMAEGRASPLAFPPRRRSDGWKIVLVPHRQMEVEQEGETLAGSPNSMLASELFPQDEESGSETETEEYLPPPSSKTTVAYVISARIRRYFDEQAEDSDEDAGEEREEEEQEMEEGPRYQFVDDTAVDEDFVHRLPSNKDDARERDVAREAAGEAGAPSAEQKTSPNSNARYTGKMLADVDVEPHTWVRAPTSSTAASAREGLGASANVQYVAEMVSQSGASFAEIALFAEKHAEWIIASRARKPSPALDAGDRVVVTTGDRKDSTGIITRIPKDWEVAGATWPSPTLRCYQTFIISIVHVTRQWAIGDSVRVTRGQYEGQAGVILGLHTGYLELLEANVGYSRHEMCPIHAKFAARTWTSSTNFGLPRQQIPLSQPRTSQRGFEGIEVIVAKSNDFIALSKEAKKRERGEGHIHIPHKGFIGMIIGDFDSRERSDRLKNGVEPPPERHTGKAPQTRIMVTIRGDHSLETSRFPIENVRHLVQYDGVPWSRLVFSAPPFCSGGNRLNHPRIHALVTYRGPSAATRNGTTSSPDLQLPSPRNAAVWGSHHRWKERITDDGFASPELVGRRLDVQILGIATLANSTISKVQRTLEGSCGWVLLSEPVTTKTRKVDVCSVGKNQNMYSIDKRCIKPRRDIDSGKWLVEITERVVIIGPDRESDRARTGIAVKFVDGAHGFYPMNSLCLSENVEVVLGSHTFPATTFL